MQSPRVWYGRSTYAMPMYVLFVSSRSGIVFNPSVGAITDHSYSVKDIDLKFKVPALYGGPWPPKAGTHFTE